MPISYMASNGNGHYLQKRVPKDLVGEYPTPIIKRYLSADLAEAKRKLPLELTRLEQEFAEKRQRRNTKPLSTLSDAEIERLTAIWLHDVMAEDEEVRQEGTGDDAVFAAVRAQVEAAGGKSSWSAAETERNSGTTEREYIQMEESFAWAGDAQKAALARGRTAIVDDEVEDLLDREGIALDRKSEAYRRLSFAVLKASVRATEMMLKRHQGDPVDTPPAPGRFLVPGIPLESEADGNRLSVVYEKWKLERRPPPKTASDFYAFVRRFIELHGDLPVTAITKRHIVAFKDAMLRFPARPSGELAKMTVPRALEVTASDASIRLLSPRTVNDKALGAVSAILGYAADNALLEANPASRVKVAMGEVKEDSRLSYELEHLRVIFRFPIFGEGARPKGGGGEAAKWLPLLGLFTGARLEEIGQCAVADCKEEAGIPYLDLRIVEAGKKRKRNTSRRKVPVHPELIRLGFLAYVEERRKAGDTRLFPQLKSERTEVTAAWSQWWGRYARKHGITDKRRVFHSFRHSFKDAGRAVPVPGAILDALQGHRSGQGEGANYGSAGYPLKLLATEMAKIQFDGLDLSHLAPSETKRRPVTP